MPYYDYDRPSPPEPLKIVMTPPQMAAVLSRGSISASETRNNVIFGSLKVVGGTLAMMGTTALCVVPEPVVTKVGCMLLVGAAGADVAASGVTQIWTGKDTTTLMEVGVSYLARKLGASDRQASGIALASTFFVPGNGPAAFRKSAHVLALQNGAMTFAMHEQTSLLGKGGHTIARHVEKDIPYLKQRLVNQPWVQAATTFPDVRSGEQVLRRLLIGHGAQVEHWAWINRYHPGAIKRLKLSGTFTNAIGYGIARGDSHISDFKSATTILNYEEFNGMEYFVLTCYPSK